MWATVRLIDPLLAEGTVTIRWFKQSHTPLSPIFALRIPTLVEASILRRIRWTQLITYQSEVGHSPDWRLKLLSFAHKANSGDNNQGKREVALISLG